VYETHFAEREIAVGRPRKFEEIVDQVGHANGGVLGAVKIFLAGVAQLRGEFVGKDRGVAVKLGERTAGSWETE
jgi:hypothetical protein